MTITTLEYIHQLLIREESQAKEACTAAQERLREAERAARLDEWYTLSDLPQPTAAHIAALTAEVKLAAKSHEAAVAALHDFENQEW